MENNKSYKQGTTNTTNMLPDDLQGSPDESFSIISKYNKLYKQGRVNNINIHPGNLKSLPDDCFFLLRPLYKS
jgi:hypothetical protein